MSVLSSEFDLPEATSSSLSEKPRLACAWTGVNRFVVNTSWPAEEKLLNRWKMAGKVGRRQRAGKIARGVEIGWSQAATAIATNTSVAQNMRLFCYCSKCALYFKTTPWLMRTILTAVINLLAVGPRREKTEKREE